MSLCLLAKALSAGKHFCGLPYARARMARVAPPLAPRRSAASAPRGQSVDLNTVGCFPHQNMVPWGVAGLLHYHGLATQDFENLRVEGTRVINRVDGWLPTYLRSDVVPREQRPQYLVRQVSIARRILSPLASYVNSGTPCRPLTPVRSICLAASRRTAASPTQRSRSLDWTSTSAMLAACKACWTFLSPTVAPNFTPASLVRCGQREWKRLYRSSLCVFLFLSGGYLYNTAEGLRTAL